eukprot:TRINITY_DN5699_c0_g1_i1.p1 TRINITY_DN5699_c0_g1~~TRINITY_DN5699_c0_g1_i1.p1  ORF type:complete len:989 (+),score=145.13 TRINITY_DN5699_c0_g1_i1:70-3036(+)
MQDTSPVAGGAGTVDEPVLRAGSPTPSNPAPQQEAPTGPTPVIQPGIKEPTTTPPRSPLQKPAIAPESVVPAQPNPSPTLADSQNRVANPASADTNGNDADHEDPPGVLVTEPLRGSVRSISPRNLPAAAPAPQPAKRRWFRSSKEPAGENTVETEEYVAGMLTKMGDMKWTKPRWHQRWFVLDKRIGVLSYYKNRLSAAEMNSLKHTKDSFDLNHASAKLVAGVQPDTSPTPPSDHYLEVHIDNDAEGKGKKTVLRICADTLAEFQMWKAALEYGIMRKFDDNGYTSPIRSGSEFAAKHNEHPEQPHGGSSSDDDGSDEDDLSATGGAGSNSTPPRRESGRTAPAGTAPVQPPITIAAPMLTLPTPALTPQASNSPRGLVPCTSEPPQAPPISPRTAEPHDEISDADRAMHASGNIISGYLHKVKDSKKKWERMWFILDKQQGVLTWYNRGLRSAEQSKQLRPRGTLDLNQANTALMLNQTAGAPSTFTFQIASANQVQRRIPSRSAAKNQHRHILNLCAASEADFRFWTGAVQACIERKHSGFVATPPAAPPAAVQSSLGTRPHSPNVRISQAAHRGHNTPLVLYAEPTASNIVHSIGVYTLLAALFLFNAVAVALRYTTPLVFTSVLLVWNVALVGKLLHIPPPPPPPQFEYDEESASSGSDVDDEEEDELAASAGSDGAALVAPPAEGEPSTACVSSTQPRGATAQDLSPPPAASRLRAGTTIPLVPNDSPNSGWGRADGKQFRVRIGPNYAKNKQKALSADSLLEILAVDLYSSEQKIEHICSEVELPPAPPGTYFFVVNCQLPSYPVNNALWGDKRSDGPGQSLVLYMGIRPETMEEAATATGGHLQLLHRFLNANKENDPNQIYDRFKVIAKVINVQELTFLGRPERRLVDSYNAQPVLTRPQHRVYHTARYTEIDVDVHTFGFIARKGLSSLGPRVKDMVMDVAVVIEAHTDEELPERILGAIRMNKLDLMGGGKPWPNS